MTPSDLALLFVLGAADGDDTAFDAICTMARWIAPLDWQPTSDVIGTTVERARRDRLVEVREDGVSGATVVATTLRGRRHAAELLRQPIPRSDGGFMRTCMSVKACFLHLLPQPDRRAEVVDLLALYRQAIDFVRRLQHLSPEVAGPALAGPALAGPALQDLRYELIRLESEFAWLEGMTPWQALPRAAE